MSVKPGKEEPSQQSDAAKELKKVRGIIQTLALHKDWPDTLSASRVASRARLIPGTQQDRRPKGGDISYEEVMRWLQAERLSRRMELRLKEAEERVSDLDARASIAKQRISILERELEASRDTQKQLQEDLAAAKAQAAADKRILQVDFLSDVQHMACMLTGRVLPRWTGRAITV